MGLYKKLSGTSQAAPFVTGVVAQILERHRYFKPAALTLAIKCMATPGIVSLPAQVPRETTTLLLYNGLNGEQAQECLNFCSWALLGRKNVNENRHLQGCFQVRSEGECNENFVT